MFILPQDRPAGQKAKTFVEISWIDCWRPREDGGINVKGPVVTPRSGGKSRVWYMYLEFMSAAFLYLWAILKTWDKLWFFGIFEESQRICDIKGKQFCQGCLVSGWKMQWAFTPRGYSSASTVSPWASQAQGKDGQNLMRRSFPHLKNEDETIPLDEWTSSIWHLQKMCCCFFPNPNFSKQPKRHWRYAEM